MKFNTIQKLLLLLTASFMLMACNNQQQTRTNGNLNSEATSPLSKLTLKDLSDKTLMNISDTSILDEFYVNWRYKTEVNFIKIPDLPYQLELVINNKTQIWLYDGHSSVTNSAKGSSAYYQLKSTALLSKFINKHSFK
ncbi:MAG: hypothetical protein COA74_11480 [Gammaproteobacteria bacterium]|nr:MAG: hypothetical protein COA74_11480 [Gammaproteobacteria bacterium]